MIPTLHDHMAELHRAQARFGVGHHEDVRRGRRDQLRQVLADWDPPSTPAARPDRPRPAAERVSKVVEAAGPGSAQRLEVIRCSAFRIVFHRRSPTGHWPGAARRAWTESMP